MIYFVNIIIKPNISSTDVDDNMAAAIIQRCLTTRPDIMPPSQSLLTIKRNAVGLRPFRKSGPRIEGEWMSKYTFCNSCNFSY